jgi:hypothetical protein
MSIRFTILSLVVLILITSSCSTVKPDRTKTNSNKNAYSEDLTVYRPELAIIEEQPTDTIAVQAFTDSAYLDQTARLNTVLDTAANYARSTITYIDGFTIQVYGGDNRALAKDFRLNLIRNFPSTEPRTVFEQPNYKVRVGQYYTRLEAQHLFTQVKRVFPRAILIPARIYVK